MLKEHDTVALIADLSTDNLKRGDVGAVVHIHADGSHLEVEFVDEHGKTRCVVTVAAQSLMRLNVLSLSA